MADELVVNPLEDEDSAASMGDSPKTFERDDIGDKGPKRKTGWNRVTELASAGLVAADIRPVLSEAELLAKHKDADAPKPAYIIDPRSAFWKVWCLVQGGVVLVLLFIVPFELAFVCMDAIVMCHADSAPSLMGEFRDAASGLLSNEPLDVAGSAGSALTPEEPCQGWDGPTAFELTVRLIVDLLITADFLMHFLLGFSYYDLKRRKPVYIWAPRTIFKHYVASPQFLYDLAGAMPIDTILRMQGTRTGFIYADIASILRLLRLQSVVEITKPLNLVIKRAAVLFPPIEPISKLLMMIISIVGITHFMACLLYFTGHPYFDDDEMCNLDDGRDTCGWVKLQGWSSDPSGTEIAAKYVTALYYASTQITTVGFGDISARTTLERLFSVFSQMFGGFVFGYVLGNISTLLAAENLALSTHSSYMETLHHFMNHEGVPATLHRRVMTYMEHRYPQRNIYDEHRLYSELTPSLRGEIAFHRFGNVIEHLPMFKDLKYQAAALLCSRIALCSFVEGDTITNHGNVADRLFIVKQGLVNVYDRDPALKFKAATQAVVAAAANAHEIDVGDATLINVVGVGHAVAELAAVMPFMQQYTCKCVEYCLVCTLQRRHILEIAGVYDDVADALEGLVRSREAEVRKLCMKDSSYEQILAQMKGLKDEVHTDVDAILGGGISGGVNFGASAMDEVTNADAVAEILKLLDMHAKLADQVQQGFEALNARLDTMQARQK